MCIRDSINAEYMGINKNKYNYQNQFESYIIRKAVLNMSYLPNLQSTQKKILWIGDLDPWMDENYLKQVFAQIQHLSNVKIIKDKNSNQSQGYGFLEFASHEAANQTLQQYNGLQMPNSTKLFRINWGTQGGNQKGTTMKQQQQTNFYPQNQPGQHQQNVSQDFSLYVGDLDQSVDDTTLYEFFRAKYKTTVGAKVIIDNATKRHKGYGFVKFSSQEEQQKALQEMNGIQLKGRQIRTNGAYWKNNQNDSTQQLSNIYSQMAYDPLLLQNLLQSTQFYNIHDQGQQLLLNQSTQYLYQQQLLQQQLQNQQKGSNLQTRQHQQPMMAKQLQQLQTAAQADQLRNLQTSSTTQNQTMQYSLDNKVSSTSLSGEQKNNQMNKADTKQDQGQKIQDKNSNQMEIKQEDNVINQVDHIIFKHNIMITNKYLQ
eukprot:TRINITY_DN847_c0_g1_i1.p1 TRINITY_DN847_c0_g1~~TRINITY_DN847_c0_g1_i1.p1  ORF type:complete len:427 (-),score=56.75 TRINITY_DN847_c0_g1_i1:217-1497(-)